MLSYRLLDAITLLALAGLYRLTDIKDALEPGKRVPERWHCHKWVSNPTKAGGGGVAWCVNPQMGPGPKFQCQVVAMKINLLRRGRKEGKMEDRTPAGAGIRRYG